MSNSLQSHGLQHTRFPCPSLSPGVCSNPCPSSRWCHPTISSSVAPFSSCSQSFPASGSFPMSRLFTLTPTKHMWSNRHTQEYCRHVTGTLRHVKGMLHACHRGENCSHRNLGFMGRPTSTLCDLLLAVAPRPSLRSVWEGTQVRPNHWPLLGGPSPQGTAAQATSWPF